ncbi:SusC/RagA family TonB-linked outer membrane protein [Pedobacter sp. LMG 31464]|uniref:SusC/RagA family TonB-linked outer membrane protein n=1 Tax=Pedobacter planticolens TaxID=2679964 RepID=A0A923DXT6_9SPHI|nr:SusC/RagA family TonB-linked outer membrane protein [Pedobacter planticolens]MBB2146027.1 SusC/RagA family TonB-linked outer membrane protein [Pedobacter planticolens]
MKKLVLSLFILLTVTVSAFAQERTISGTVTSSEDGLPIPGASVKVKEAPATSVATGADGKFSLRVPANAKTLLISYLGFTQVERAIPANGVVTVNLVPDTKTLSEVVVTSALGVARTQRSLGTAQQTVKADDLTQTKQPDLNSALAGKVAGVQILGGSGARFGTAAIRIRGISSIDGGRDPLFVVDGIVVPSTSINMDDVEEVTVLKGPAATSLYGQRGDAGVVVVKSKTASKKGFGIDVNHSTTFESVATLPEYQNEYGGGGTQAWNTFVYNAATDAPALAAMNGARWHDFQTDESWGPKFDGLPYAPFYSWNKFDPQYATQVPYVAQPNNIRDFYETGIENNSNIAFSQSSEKFNARVSYTNINRTGVSPNTKADQNRFSFNGEFKPIAKLKLTGNFNYNVINYFNRPAEGYGTQTAGSFNQWFHRDVNIEKLKAYKNPDGTFTSWNITNPRNAAPKYWDNPYTEAYENTALNNSTRAFGSIMASYNILPELTLDFTAKGTYASARGESRIASRTLVLERYANSQSRSRENNYVVDLGYKKQFGDFNFSASAYGELRVNRDEDISGNTVGGFTVPDYYNLAASKDRPTLNSNFFDKKVRSVYGFVSTNYKNYLFLDLNIRNDWSSSLPDANNSYLYGGASLAFVFTDLLPKNDVLSFGKVSTSFGRTGSDIGALNIYQTYNSAGFWGTTPALTTPDRIPNLNLKPALSDAVEVGVDLKFLKNRLSFSANYYNRKSTDQIISVTLPSTTGFTSALINAGEITSKGYEFTLGGTPIKTSSFSWDLNANFATAKNKIVSLYPGLDNFDFGSFGYTGTPRIRVERRVGQAFGDIVTGGIKKDAAGNQLIDDDGFPILEEGHHLGSFVPDLTGGLTSNFNYKGFTAGFSMDFQIGGKLFSVTKGNMMGSGLSPETAGLNDKGKPKRDAVSAGGGILIPGVRASDGKPNTTYVDPQDYYEGYIPYAWEEQTYRATYFKLREVSIGYNLPSKLVSRFKAQRASLTLVARNPWLIYTAVPGIDPSESAGNWNEGGQLPGTRTIGLNLKITF